MSMHTHANRSQSLNGWWDFLPVTGTPSPEVPRKGWIEGKLLVPSFWTKLTDGIRRAGETRFTNQPDIFKHEHGLEGVEFLFDGFGYPPEWSRTRCGWIRRNWRIPHPTPPGKRVVLQFDALMPKGTLFVNGRRIVTHIHPALPLEADVTAAVREGDNEIAVLIEDYDRDDRGRPLVPSGNWITLGHCGIWQDVRWLERGEVYVGDTTIRTSVRQGRLWVAFEIRNASARERRITLRPEVRRWRRGADPDRMAPLKALPEIRLAIPPEGVAVREIAVPWRDAPLWQPESPVLLELQTGLFEQGECIGFARERFGFREVWIDGPDLMLNHAPAHLFSDWGHKLTPFYCTEGWIRQWFGMIRDNHMNHTRLHTHPHPSLILDLADEEGILVTGETGLHGSSGGLAGDEPLFWEAARDHIRRFVRRDKNHPSIVLWSVENEMRWLSVKTRMVFEQLPELRLLFNALDPTRPAYHEGDSSLWNESDQPLISRHYQKSCAGIGWWNRRQPLHSGEMALYHYSGPNNVSHLVGDQAWSSYRHWNEGAALDTALIIETARTLGVCCLGPWNLSCLENLRSASRLMRLKYPDYTVPGVKPLQVPAHSSEFNFWEQGKGYTPNFSFRIQKQSFRPLALIDRSQRSGYFAGARLRRELFLVNDTAAAVSGWIEIRISRAGDGRALLDRRIRASAGRGRTAGKAFDLQIPRRAQPGTYRYQVRFVDAHGRQRDGWTRTLRIGRRIPEPGRRTAPLFQGVVAVFGGSGELDAVLDALGLNHRPVSSLTAEALRDARLLVIARNAVQAGSGQNREVQAFARAGGRVLVLEQRVSLFPSLPVVEKPLQKNFIRVCRHPAFSGLRESDLAFWGDDPYPLLAGNADVAKRMFRKNDALHTVFLSDGDEGGFGHGGLGCAGLLETREGDGLILACQLRLTECMADIPAAERLFVNLLLRAVRYRPRTGAAPLLAEDATPVAEAVAAARAGRDVIVRNADAATLAAYGRALRLGLKARQGVYYQAVRVKADPVLDGVSNEDTCGILKFSYTPGTVANHVVAATALEPVAGLEALLATPTENCLEDFFVHGGMSEPLRAHTSTRFRMSPSSRPLVLLGRVRAGKGAIYFNQIAPTPEAPESLRRLEHRLYAALGGVPGGSALDGPCVPAGAASSPGHPQMMHVLNVAPDPALHGRLLESTRYSLEHINSTPVLGFPGWTVAYRDDGQWSAAELDPARDIYLYSLVISQVARKDVSSNLGVPNPDVLTFLRLTGKGRVDVALNGEAIVSLALDGEATISDLALEAGGNHLLLRWRAPSREAVLTMHWEDIEKRPETGLAFR